MKHLLFRVMFAVNSCSDVSCIIEAVCTLLLNVLSPTGVQRVPAARTGVPSFAITKHVKFVPAMNCNNAHVHMMDPRTICFAAVLTDNFMRQPQPHQ